MRIVVVGAGPGGAATALLLARGGADVTLVDRESDFERVFRGEALMPHGLEALHQMGLAEALAAMPGEGILSWKIHLDRVLAMDLEEPAAEGPGPPPRIVPPGALIQALIDAASQTGRFDLQAPLTVRDVVREGDRVVGVRGETPSGAAELRADLVIGADGRASVIRKRTGLELELLPESYDILWFKLPAPEPALVDPSSVQIYASGPEGALGYLSWDGRFQVAWMLPKGGWREARQRDWLAECAALFPEPLAAHALSHRDAIEGPSLLDVIVGRAPVWARPGVLLLGDAAHPMSPIRAQGINMALRDAVVAANHLVPALDDPGAIEAACRALQAEREREVVPTQKLQLREVRGQRWARNRPWLMNPLLKLAPLIVKSSFVRGLVQRSWARQQRPLRFGVADVKLRV